MRAAAAACLAAGLLAGCGDGERAATTPLRVPDVRAPQLPASALQRLPVGLGEANPALLWHPDARPAPEGFALAREAAHAVAPSRVRLIVDWARVQPEPGQPADLEAAHDGCLRGAPPCASWAGVREQLQAIASRGRGGAPVPEVVVTVHGVPDWAARPASGCERPSEQARSRPVTEAGLEAYGALVRDVVALAAREGAPVTRWSPWNEPNHPAFVSPQRGACDPASEALAPAVYADLARAAREALPRDTGLLLGDLAGYDEPTAHTSSVGEFVGALPDEVACAPGAVWAVHQFAGPRGTEGARSDDATRTLRRALDRRPCTREARIWVTETGAGARDPGRARSGSAAELRAGCRGLARVLRRWDRDPRIDGVFQYTVREDPLHPVGLVDPGMTRVHPSAALLAAWGRTGPGDPPPRPGACV